MSTALTMWIIGFLIVLGMLISSSDFPKSPTAIEITVVLFITFLTWPLILGSHIAP